MLDLSQKRRMPVCVNVELRGNVISVELIDVRKVEMSASNTCTSLSTAGSMLANAIFDKVVNPKIVSKNTSQGMQSPYTMWVLAWG